MAVRFRGAVFEGGGQGGSEDVRTVEEGFGALVMQCWGGVGMGEGGWEGWGRVGRWEGGGGCACGGWHCDFGGGGGGRAVDFDVLKRFR